MATTVAHASLIRYDDNGNQLVINLKNTGDDVSINRSSNGNLPTGATTVQGLANSLGALAFKNSLSKADVGLGNVDNTADANKSVNYASTAGAANAVAWGNVSGKPSVPESGDFSTDTLEDLLKSVQGKSPRMGSVILGKETRVANNWYNFIYIPHRTGIGGDNKDYGTLVLFPMTFDGESAIIRAGQNGSVQSIYTLYSSRNISEASVSYATTASYLADSQANVGPYAPSDSHFLQLGYWICGTDYDSLVLLVSSSFWGNQHGSSDLFYLQQDMNDDGNNTTVTGDFYLTHLGGSYRRDFYYHKTDGKIYLYAYVLGGNSYGRWNVSVLQSPWPYRWVNTKITNCKKSAEWIKCEQFYTPFEDNLYVSKSTPGHSCIWAKID